MALARHCKGDVKPIRVAVDSDVVIRRGDFVELVSGKAVPIASHTWNTNIATTQEEIHDIFLGISLDDHEDGDTVKTDVQIATGGIWEMDCAAATFTVGDMIGPAKQTGDAVENQKIVATATPQTSVGRIEKHYGSNTTRAKFRLLGGLVEGGVQASA